MTTTDPLETAEREAIQAEGRREELLLAALAYAAAGVPVLRVHYVKNGGCSCPASSACTKAAKHPYGTAWQNAATTDPDMIREWWGEDPWNVGTLVRKDGTVTVLDVEGSVGHQVDGRATFERLSAGLVMDAFPRSRTPSGGSHVWGRRPEDLETLEDPAPGIECFGEGAKFKMIVLPPSETPTGRYEWLGVGFEPEDLADLRPFPTQLWNGAARSNGHEPPPAATTLTTTTTTAPPMARHDFMLKIAGSMRRQGAEPEEILAALHAMRASRGWADKPDDELERIARDIGTKPTAASDPWPDPRPLAEATPATPYPFAALPAALRSYVLAVGEEVQAPAEAAATLALGILSRLLIGRVRARMSRTWHEDANLL